MARLAWPFCCSAQFRPYLLCSKPVKPGHYKALRAHILRVLLTKYGEMAQLSGIIKVQIGVLIFSLSETTFFYLNILCTVVGRVKALPEKYTALTNDPLSRDQSLV